MDLHVISHNWFTKEVTVAPVEITKETEKTVQVSYNRIVRTIRKSELPHAFRYHELITSDVEAGIALWNAQVEKDIEACYKTLEDLKSKKIVK